MPDPTSDDDPTLARMRAFVASLPDAMEQRTWDHPTFRVRGKIFATYGIGDGGTPQASIKANKAEQVVLLTQAGFFMPAYVGRHGWVGVRLGEVAWDVVEDLLEEAYRMTASKKQVARLDAR